MKPIFKFKTEKQLNGFDKDIKASYSGSLGHVWIYGEGTNRWFTLQYNGDRWSIQKREPKTSEFFGTFTPLTDFYPYTYKEIVDFVNDFLK